jgi:DegV family protein with EDD domain
MKIAISAESTIDLSKDMLKKLNISTVPFGVLLGDELVNDGDITIDELFDFVKKKNILPKTSAVNEFQFKEHFEKLLKNHDAVIHFSLSSEASCAYANAKSVADKMENVFVVDSLSLSTGIALLALNAIKLMKEGKTAQEIYDVSLKLREKIQVSFIIEKLNYLYKGGRCSALQLFGSNLLRIRPQIVLNKGKMSVGKKFRGNINDATKSFCNSVIEDNPNPELDIAFITYTTATEEMLNHARTALKNKGFKNIYEIRAGCTIASHCGEHTLGLLFINK